MKFFSVSGALVATFDLNYDVSALPVLPDFSISIFGNSINLPLSLNWNEKNKYETVRTLISVIRGFLIFFVTYKFFLLIFHEIKDLK